jgi:hypothetical protein
MSQLKDWIDLKWMYGYSAAALPEMATNQKVPPVALASGEAALDAIRHQPMR